MKYHAIFLSDLHLGSPKSQADKLNAFFADNEAEVIYLVGDIVDWWSWRWGGWPRSHYHLIKRVLMLAADGTRIVYVPGNHDRVARHFVGKMIFGVEIAQRARHLATNGRIFLVTHGDEHDDPFTRSLAFLSEISYRINHLWDWLADTLDLVFHTRTNTEMNFRTNSIFDACVAGLGGVICGHTHVAGIKFERASDVTYANCGDLVGSGTLLVENLDGRLEIKKI